MATYIVKASWRATAKLLRIEARTPEEALLKAMKRKDTKGHLTLQIQDQRPCYNENQAVLKPRSKSTGS